MNKERENIKEMLRAVPVDYSFNSRVWNDPQL